MRKKYKSIFMKLNDPHLETKGKELLQQLSKGKNLSQVKNGKHVTSTYVIDPELKTFGVISQKIGGGNVCKISDIIDVVPAETCIQDVSDEIKKKRTGFVLFFSGTQPYWFMVAPTLQERDTWVKCLKFIMAEAQIDSEESLSHAAFLQADINNDKLLTFEEVLKLLHSMNFTPNKSQVYENFDICRTKKIFVKNKPVISLEEFTEFWKRLHRRLDLEDLFFNFQSGKGYMNQDNFLLFLHNTQNMKDATIKDVREIMQKSMFCDKDHDALVYKAFHDFMIENEKLFNSDHEGVYQDMNHPIVDYYISSSHNTQLTGDQLFGGSDVDMYIRVIMGTCRSVDVEVHEKNNKLLVSAGKSFTGALDYEVVIQKINEYSFRLSPYPLIIRIETHCSQPFRTKAAAILKKTMAGKIWHEKETGESYPSPEMLKYKVLLMGKIVAIGGKRDEMSKLIFLPDNEQKPTHNVIKEMFFYKIGKEDQVRNSKQDIKKNVFNVRSPSSR